MDRLMVACAINTPHSPTLPGYSICMCALFPDIQQNIPKQVWKLNEFKCLYSLLVTLRIRYYPGS